MGAFDLSISADDLAALQNVPQQIVALATTAQQTLAGARSGDDTTNPVGALFSGLQSLTTQAGGLPELNGLLGPIRDLAGQLPTRALADAQQIGGEVTKVLGLFGPLLQSVQSGAIDGDLSGYVERTVADLGSLFRPGAEVTSLLGELEEFLVLFRGLLTWGDRPPSAADVATLIARALAGMPLDLLGTASSALQQALGTFDALLPDGADLGRWRAVSADRLSFWQDIAQRAQGTVDWSGLEARLRNEAALLVELAAVRDRLLHTALANLGRVDVQVFGAVGTAIAGISEPRDFRLMPILDGLRRQLESTAERIEAWVPTDEDVLGLARGLGEQLLSYVEQSPLGQLRTLLVNFQQRLLHAIEDLPLRDLAHQAETLLRDLASKLQIIDPELIKRPVHEFFTSIESQLDVLVDNPVVDSIGTLWASVGEAVQQIAAQVQTLKATLDGLTAQLTQLSENVAPALQQITEAAGTIGQALESFDLEQPTQAVIEELHTLRDKVAALDLSNLPQPAVSGIKAAAEFLRNLDLAGTLNPALNDALAQLDPTSLISEAADAIGGVTAQLTQFDPASLTRDLDAPVDALLAEFARLGPDQFKALLETALSPVEEALNGLDFASLFAPITQLFAELTAKIDALLNPDVIFAPLEALFQPLIDVVDQLKPSRFIDLIAPHAGDLVQGVGSQGGPPASITTAGLRDAIPSGAEVDEELFGFRIGDLLVPLIDLHRQLTRAFDALDRDLLSQAMASLQNSLSGPLSALAPGRIQGEVDTRLNALGQLFDPGQFSVQLSDAVFGYHDAAAAVATAARAVDAAAPEHAAAQRVLGLLGTLNPVMLVPERTQFEAVAGASIQLRASIDWSSVHGALPKLARVQTLLPDFLQRPNLGANTIRAALAALDPAPLRIEINQFFDRIGRRIVSLERSVALGFEELGRLAEEFILPVTPSALLHVADALHAGLKAQVLEFSPSRFKDEVTLIFDVVKNQLHAFDPSVLVQELDGLRAAVIQKLHDLVEHLLPDPAPFHQLQDQLALLKPSQILAPLVDTLQPVTDLVAALDPHTLFQPLIDAIARVRTQLPDVVAELEAALDEVLAAFPEGGTDSASGSLSAG